MAILPNNIDIWDKPKYWENTCRALPPNSSDPQGKIVLLPGGGGDSSFLTKVITRPIYGAGTTVDVDVASSTEHDLPNPGWLHGHTDNQVVRQRDGTLAARKACFNWKPVPNPKPWQQLSIPENRKPYEEQVGPRATNFVWRGELSPLATEIQWRGVQKLGSPFDWWAWLVARYLRPPLTPEVVRGLVVPLCGALSAASAGRAVGQIGELEGARDSSAAA
jgi:hypothetical protein